MQLPWKWRDRIKAFLFFDRNFGHIANNKLSLSFKTDEEVWFNQTDEKVREVARRVSINPSPHETSRYHPPQKKFSYLPKNVNAKNEKKDKTSFIWWLQQCHARLDTDTVYSNRASAAAEAEAGGHGANVRLLDAPLLDVIPSYSRTPTAFSRTHQPSSGASSSPETVSRSKSTPVKS
jgi:hypothetical protein